ncbi:MAG: FtsQ-type POTRA domain-containing protein [Peptococcaceae bacterium]|nr:FtsQ-type POTRA domain-containing protein [Peptococcaceae bacterium]
MFSKSNFFSVKDIKTTGLTNVSEDEVIKLMGAVKGENIFLTDTEAIAKKVRLHPLIDKVEIKKALPGTLILKIQERVPVALILSNDGMVEVDSQGTILRFYETWPQKDQPVITGIQVPETIGPGQKLGYPQLDKALLLIRQAPEGLSPLVGEIHMNSDGQVNLYLTSGTQVKLGYGDQFTEKLRLLKELLDSKEYKSVEKAIKYIDLTAGKPVLGR